MPYKDIEDRKSCKRRSQRKWKNNNPKYYARWLEKNLGYQTKYHKKWVKDHPRYHKEYYQKIKLNHLIDTE